VITRLWPPLVVLALLLGAWQLYVASGGVDDLVLASPTQIARSLYEDRSLLLDNLGVTAVEVGLGVLIALALGLVLGVLLHWSAMARRAFYPLMVASQAVPLVIFAPLLVYWFGFGVFPKLVIVALICFFPVVVTTFDGLRRLDPDLHKLMRTLDATRWQTFRLTELPAALPAALSGARIAVAIAVIGAFLAETAGSTKGLGHLLLQAIPALETPRAYAAAVVMAAFAIVLFYALGLAERRLSYHRPRSS
jgi:NitT/TauT family transport system permease protein/putative hydroxymethylpyrimidine transport system permease protein